jgi:hypothetical protein
MADIKEYILTQVLSSAVVFDGTNTNQIQALISVTGQTSYEVYQLTAEPDPEIGFVTEIPAEANPADYSKFLYFPAQNVRLAVGGYVGVEKLTHDLILEPDETSLLQSRDLRYPPV